MSVNLPNWYAHQYSTNIQLKLQAMGSVLRPYVTEGSYVGDQASPVDFMSSVEMQDVVQRFAPMGRVDAATDRRWVFPVDSDLPQMIDAFDKLRLLTDPESKTVENGVIAAGRRLDKHILNAFFADAKTGVAGAATTSFTSANEVDVAGKYRRGPHDLGRKFGSQHRPLGLPRLGIESQYRVVQNGAGHRQRRAWVFKSENRTAPGRFEKDRRAYSAPQRNFGRPL